VQESPVLVAILFFVLTTGWLIIKVLGAYVVSSFKQEVIDLNNRLKALERTAIGRGEVEVMVAKLQEHNDSNFKRVLDRLEHLDNRLFNVAAGNSKG
jgi:hypothetical protein